MCSKKQLEKLFNEGKSFFYFPVKVVYILNDLKPEHPVQAAFSVSRKNFRKATSRNFIRRKMKEIYRLNKQELNQVNPKFGLSVIFIYISAEISEFTVIEKAVQSAIYRLSKILTATKNARDNQSDEPGTKIN